MIEAITITILLKPFYNFGVYVNPVGMQQANKAPFGNDRFINIEHVKNQSLIPDLLYRKKVVESADLNNIFEFCSL